MARSRDRRAARRRRLWAAGLGFAVAGTAAAIPAPAGFFTADTGSGASDAVAAGRRIFENGAGGPVAACTDCHGARGAGRAADAYPAIGGLQAAYVRAQLAAYADGSRADTTMTAIAKGMTPAEMAQVAAYTAGLPGLSADEAASVASVGGPDLVRRGRILFQYGKKISRDEWVPACRLCHGDDAQGAGERFPPLAGQHATYVEKQLNAWREGQRSSDPIGLMTSVAVRLSAADVKAVAAYLAAIGTAEQPIWPYSPADVTP